MQGILFKPWKIRFIRSHPDIEIQTRRVIKQLSPEFKWEVIDAGEPIRMFKDGIGGCIFLKPRYQEGRVHYIKEAYYCDPGGGLWYALDDNGDYPDPESWKSPLFMPARFARYFLKVIVARPERLQNISAKGIMAEGLPDEYENCEARDAVEWFIATWDAINKNYPWKSNPLVWAYTLIAQKEYFEK